ncbi:oligoribonuclease [Halalkalibacter sp. AB-rgal2]|uniref:oligoribonuclease n=1 Tax=Halalkalibacter sp. AB-rgal2 TaxID=3242695 RepID=UPI00359ED591
MDKTEHQEKEPIKKVSHVKKQTVAAKYTREEVFHASSSFGVSRELMFGALRLIDKDEFTKSEVEKAIKTFKTRKVNAQ